MSRKLRIQYRGAIYHLMNRGDHRERIFEDDPDRERFLATLGECCQKNALAYQDDESDLFYYGYRYYNASTGRWISRDPKGESRDGGLCVFVRNEPTVAFDRLGLAWVWDVAESPSQFNVGRLGRDSATKDVLSELDYSVEACLCGLRMNDFRIRARITMLFGESQKLAGADGSIAHEAQHARIFYNKYVEIAKDASVIFMKCVSFDCFEAWINEWNAVQAHAYWVSQLQNDRVDFNDPEYDPAARPTQAQIDADVFMVNETAAGMLAAKAERAKVCGF